MSDFEAWIVDCHLAHVEVDGGYRCQSAVWADGHESAMAILAAHLKPRGYRILWVEECHPAWDHRGDNARSLVQAVDASHPVELGPIHGENAQTNGCLTIGKIKGVEPLDAQFGVWPPKPVPDMLCKPLFGQPEPTEDEITQFGGIQAIPPMKTYAILDAAKVIHLPELLGNSDLLHRCLFKGEAAQEYRNVAPYLVELEMDNRLTRSLFTYLPDQPEDMSSLHMWHKEPGIYIRSRAGFDEVWKHFRKFTRVQDETGKWYYFRFWSPSSTIPYFEIIGKKADKLKYWSGNIISSIVVPQSRSKAVITLSFFSNNISATPSRFVLEDDEMAGLMEGKVRVFQDNLVKHCSAQVENFAALSDDQKKKIIGSLLSSAKKAELRSEKAIANYVEASLRHGAVLESSEEYGDILKRPWQTEIERTELLIERVKEKQHG